MIHKVYVFGNPNETIDNKPFLFLEKLRKDFPQIEFKIVKPNEDLPTEEQDMYIIDTVLGLSEIKILDDSVVDKLSISKSSSVHDYDLGFQLKYLKKLGKIKNIKILGIPMNTKIDYDSVHSNFKKFVAQDIQGS